MPHPLSLAEPTAMLTPPLPPNNDDEPIEEEEDDVLSGCTVLWVRTVVQVSESHRRIVLLVVQ